MLLLPLRDALIFFFQAEDGIRDLYVTGVQTCALPISPAAEDDPPADESADKPPAAEEGPEFTSSHLLARGSVFRRRHRLHGPIALYGGQIGRASCRERV